MKTLDNTEVNKLLASLEFNWQLKDKSLVLQVQSKDFAEAIWAIDEIAKAAEELNHHPSLALRDYNHLEVVLSTHSGGGVTTKDLALAEKVDAIIARLESK